MSLTKSEVCSSIQSAIDVAGQMGLVLSEEVIGTRLEPRQN